MYNLFHNKRISLISITRFTIFTFLIVLLTKSILSARPVSDDYCTALIATTTNPLSGTMLYISNWSFSAAMLPVLSIWSFGLNSITSSILLTGIGVTIGVVLVYKFLPINSRLGRCYVMSLFPLSLALIRFADLVDSYPFKLQYIFSQLPEVLSGTFKLNNFDNQIFIWWLGTPIVLYKTINISLLLYGIVAAKKNNIKGIMMVAFYFLLYGISLESLIFLVFLIMITWRRRNSELKSFYVCATAIFATLFVLESILSGTNSRLDVTNTNDFTTIITNFIYLSCYFLAITFLVRILKLNIDFFDPQTVKEIKFNLTPFKDEIRIILISSALITALFGSTLYLSSYHWITFIFFTVLWQFLSTKDYINLYFKTVTSGFAIWLLISSLLSISAGFGTLQQRASAWDQRRLEIIKLQTKKSQPVPLENSSGVVLAYDMSNQSSSIVPDVGFKTNHTKYCFFRLPVTW